MICIPLFSVMFVMYFNGQNKSRILHGGKTIFYELAQRVSKILFLPRENKIHIFKPPCNVLFII